MPIIKLIGFMGEIPSRIPRTLPDAAAQEAFNVRLDDGGLTPFRQPREVTSISSGPSEFATIFRHKGQWYGWANEVKALPGPVDDDRLYVFGDGIPKLIYGGSTYPLSLSSPTVKPTLTVAGTATSDLGTNRFYVYTFVTDLGEESQPSPPSDSVYWKPGQSSTLSGIQAPPSGRRFTKQRFYRAQTAATGTSLYFIAERDASSANFVDTVALDAINEPLPSLDWDAPLDSLKGAIALPNGMMAAFSGKKLYFCEPWRPHAWPEKYSLTTDFEIVGLGAFGNSVAVLTSGVPYVATGTEPASMAMEKLELNYPCLSSRAIEDLGYAVVYPSTDGLISISASGATVITNNGVFTRSAWERLRPDTMHSGQRGGRYFVTYVRNDSVEGLVKETMIIDPSGQQPFVIHTNINPDAMFYSIEDGSLYFSKGQVISEFDAVGKPNELMSWKSKEFVVDRPTNFGAILVEVERALTPEQEQELIKQAEEDIAYNQTVIGGNSVGSVNEHDLDEFSVNGDNLRDVTAISYNASVNVYADGVLVANVTKMNELDRLPGGFLARRWEIQVTGNIKVLQITMARTGIEMMGA